MASFSLVHWLVVAVVVLVLFGRGKISETMGDFGKGIKSFRKGMTEEESAPAPKLAQITVANDGNAQPATTDAGVRTTNS
ncbi:twin-arginine translocase TatA/TatE family subunit [Croceibacterium ferulae]|uniref:twin-arginine translocase TatA/TatE family subunit n=1 Tax=Croceibacterium ferulae TaxID=1854641 RepID=UPI000EB4C58B|nr:twin-arginine translocase TatA/TatE family subunit [Croceibacterium ferulae]